MENSNNNKLTLELFGQSFSFTTDAKKEELIKVLNYYKHVVNSIEKKFPNRSHLDIAVLTGLIITDELYMVLKSRNKNLNSEEEELDTKIIELINSLDTILKE